MTESHDPAIKVKETIYIYSQGIPVCQSYNYIITHDNETWGQEEATATTEWVIYMRNLQMLEPSCHDG